MKFGEHEKFLQWLFGLGPGRKIAFVLVVITIFGVFYDELLKLIQLISLITNLSDTYLGSQFVRFVIFLVCAGFLCYGLRKTSTGEKHAKIWNFIFFGICFVVTLLGLKHVIYNPLKLHYQDLPMDIEGYPSLELVLVGPESQVTKRSISTRTIRGKVVTTGKQPFIKAAPAQYEPVPLLGFVDKKVTRLVLQNFDFSKASSFSIPENIEHLKLENCSGLTSLRPLHLKHQKIHTLEILACADLESLEGLEGVANNHKKYLSIVRLHNNSKLKSVAALQTFKNVVVFELVGSGQVTDVAVVAAFEHLQQLGLEDVEQVTDQPYFYGLKTLRHLSLVNTGIRSLTTFANAGKLDALVLNSNPLIGFGNLQNDSIEEDDLPPFPFPFLTSIKWVGPISEQGLRYLLSTSKGLFALELSEIGNPLDAAVLVELVPRCRVLKLNAVDLTSNPDPLFSLPIRHLSLTLFSSDSLLNMVGSRRERWRSGIPGDQIEILELSAIDIKNGNKGHLSFEMFPKLKELRLERVSGEVDWFSINKKHLPDLVELSIRSCSTNNDLTFLRTLDRLSVLELSSDYYRLKNLDLLNLTSIKTLQLEGNIEIDDLSFLSRAVKLEHLSFESFNGYLSLKLPNIPRLKRVTVERCRNLKLLDLSKNTQVTELAIASNRDDIARLVGITRLKRVNRVSLPSNLKGNTLSSHVLPRQTSQLEYLKIYLNQPVLH